MTVPAATVNQYYAGIFRQAPSAAVSAAYQAMSSADAALNSMLSAANVQVDPVIRLYQTAFNRVPDSPGMTAWVVPFSTGQITLQQIATGFTQSTEFTALYPTTLSNAQYVGALYWNILQRTGEDAGIQGWVNALNSGALTRAQVLLGFSESQEFKANIEPNVNAFLTNCANNTETYTGSLFDQGASGETFLITTSQFSYTGTRYDDVFNAPIEASGIQALQTLDSINGNGGDDTLNAFINASVAPSVLTSIENIDTVFSNGGAVLNLLRATDLVTLENTSSTTAAQYTNIHSTDVELQVSNLDNIATTFSYTAAAVIGTNTANLVLNSVTGGADITINGVETVAVTSSGSANDVDLLGAALTTINVAGDQDIDLNAIIAGVTTVNAAALTGDLVADIDNQVSNASATSVTGGSGDDDFFVTDTQIGTGTVASVLDGGLGINAVIASYTADQANVVDAGSITISNMQEVLLFAEDTAGAGAVDLGLDASLVGGLEVVSLNGEEVTNATSNVFTITNLTADQIVSIDTVGGTGVTADITGDTDVTSANILLNIGADSAAAFDINEAGAATALTTLNIATDANSYTNVDVEQAFATINIEGGAAGEALTIGATTAVTATTVAAADLLSDLTATFGAANQSVTGGAGDDTFIFGTNLNTADTVDGGTGSNTVAFTLGAGLVGPHLSNVQALDVTLTNTSNTMSFQNSSGIETITVVATGAATDDASFTNLDAALTDIVIEDDVDVLTVNTAAGQLANVTMTIGVPGGAGMAVDEAVINTRGSLTVTVVDDTVGAGTFGIDTSLATNVTSLTFETSTDDILDVAGAVTANSAETVTVSASTGNVSVDGGNSFDALDNLVIGAAAGAAAVFIGTSNTAETDLTVGSVVLTTDENASLVTSTLSITASTAAAASLDATLSSLSVTNGLDSDVTSTVNLTATNSGVASITSIDVVNAGDTGDLVDMNLNFVAAAAGSISIGALNVNVAADAEVNVDLDVGAGETIVTVGAGDITGAGQLDFTTSDLTELDLSSLTVSAFTGTLSVVSDADLDVLVGTAYGDTLDVALNVTGANVTGGVGSDAIALDGTGAATDTVTYTGQADSTASVYDYVAEFEAGAGGDVIDLSALLLGGAAFGGVTADATVTYTSDTDVTFTIAAADAAGFFGADQALAADDGAGNNATVVFIDANLSGSWEADADMAIVLLGVDATALADADNFAWA